MSYNAAQSRFFDFSHKSFWGANFLSRTALWAFCLLVLILIKKACQVVVASLGQINFTSYVSSDQMGKF